MDRVKRFKMAYNYLDDKKIISGHKDVAEAMKSSRSNVSMAYNGHPECLTDRFLLRFCKAFPIINVNWLLSEDGEMITNKEIDKSFESGIDQKNSVDLLSTLINQVSKLSEHLTATLQRLDERELELDKREKELFERTKKIDAALSSAIELEQKYSQLYNSQNNYIGYSHDMVSEPFNELKSK